LGYYTIIILLYYYILYIILYYYIHYYILYPILYSSPHLLPFLISSSPPILPLPSLPLLFCSLPSLSIILPSQYSKYTCRYLHILIYIIRYSKTIFCSLPSLLFPTILYLSVLTYTYLYSPNLHTSTILTPHVLSEWMVEVCGKYLCIDVLVLSWWKMIVFRAGVVLYCIILLYIYYYILYYYYILLLLYIYYYILYYTLLFFFLPISHPLFFLSFSSPTQSFSSSLSSVLSLIHSILVGTYIYLFIFQPQSNNLTPHKLSEGCLEWCSFICVVFGSVCNSDPARSIGVDG
jgi:hypothetical protein